MFWRICGGIAVGEIVVLTLTWPSGPWSPPAVVPVVSPALVALPAASSDGPSSSTRPRCDDVAVPSGHWQAWEVEYWQRYTGTNLFELAARQQRGGMVWWSRDQRPCSTHERTH